MNAELPVTGKSKGRSSKTNDVLNAKSFNDIEQQNATGDFNVRQINSTIVDECGVQMQVNTERASRGGNSNQNKSTQRASSDSSEDSSPSDDESTDSSSMSDEDRSYKRRGKKPRKKRRRKHAKRDESSDEDRDEYHQRLLEKHPGLKDFIAKQGTSGSRKEKKSRKRRRHEKRRAKREAKRRRESSKFTSKGSPSVETMYTPAVNKIDRPRLSPQVTTPVRLTDVTHGAARVHRMHANNSITGSSSSSSNSDSSSSETDEAEERDRNIHRAAEQLIVDSEKFKAAATALPEGINIDRIKIGNYNYNDDDNFMVSTCHVEPSLIEKIELGKAIALSKLINKSLKDEREETELKMELLNRDGQCYWSAVKDKDNKITGVKKWEQAFRVYMSIYSKANPTRSSEILAYADIISNAAASYTWENVSNYDFYFRKLMERHPERSWARIHNQLWSLMMKDHIQSRPHAGNSGGGANNSRKDWRQIACWRYNRNKCTRSPGECKFEHRCSFCGSFSHKMYACPKRTKNDNKPKGSRTQETGDGKAKKRKKSKKNEETNDTESDN